MGAGGFGAFMAGSQCNDLTTDDYPGVVTSKGSSVPAAKGGAIEEGKYLLDAVSLVPSPGYTVQIDPTPVAQVLRYEGGLLSLVRSALGQTLRLTASIETRCEQITLSTLCPSAGVESGKYTADPGSFTLILPTQGATVVSHYKRLEGAGGSGGAAGQGGSAGQGGAGGQGGGASGTGGSGGQGGAAGAATCDAALPGDASCSACLASKCCSDATVCQFGSSDCLACFKAGFPTEQCLEDTIFHDLALCGHVSCAKECMQFASCGVLFAKKDPCRNCLETLCCEETAALMSTGGVACLDPDSGIEFGFCKDDAKYKAYRECRASLCSPLCPKFQ